MNRISIVLIVALLAAMGYSVFTPSAETRLPLVIQGVYWAVPSSPPAVPTDFPTWTPTATGTSTSTPTITPTATATTAPDGPCPCSANTLNCSDFSTHSAAQACFDFCESQGAGDIHKLDQDNDGDACESLAGGFTVIR